MAKIFMTCGKICSGKSTYAKKLKTKYNAVILSVDEITLTPVEQAYLESIKEVSKEVKKKKI